jgi:hypothetical protein
VLALWASVGRGELALAEFVELAAVVVATANVQGHMLAELSLLSFLETSTGRTLAPVAAPPLAHYLDDGRLRLAVQTITSSELDTTMQLDRLARSEPVESSQRAYGEAMARSERVTGWTRGLEAQACQLCRWWARDGQVWPSDHPMPTHKGCHCTPVPVTS